MQDLIIDVGRVEEMQTVKDVSALDEMFRRAKQVLVGGGTVALVREQRSGETWTVGELSTLEDFDEYKKNVYKYLPE